MQMPVSSIERNAWRMVSPRFRLTTLMRQGILSALQNHPEMNAHFLGDRLAVFHEVNLGIAVDSPRGLMVPVVEEASKMSLKCSLPKLRKRRLPVVKEQFNRMIFLEELLH